MKDVAKRSDKAPIYLQLRRKEVTKDTSGVEFSNCYVFDNKNRPFMKIEDSTTTQGIYDAKGEINVINPHGARLDVADSPGGKKLQKLKINRLKIQ